MADLQIEYVPATDLVPYENNSRTHSQPQVDQIKRSMTEFGFTNPILVDERNGIIAGHGRLQAAQELGIKLVPTIALKGLTEAQRKAYVIADNQLALNAGWDLDLLNMEMSWLLDFDFDLTLTGFDSLPEIESVIDYSILDEDESELNEMAKGVRKAIQIEFEPDHYNDASELVKFWRGQGAYVGYMIMQFLQSEKVKLNANS
jgi:ParB-like chromosome segregation protein Spo0J